MINSPESRWRHAWLYELSEEPTNTQRALLSNSGISARIIPLGEKQKIFERKSKPILKPELRAGEAALFEIPIVLEDLCLEGPNKRIDFIMVGGMTIVKKGGLFLLIRDDIENRAMVGLNGAEYTKLETRIMVSVPGRVASERRGDFDQMACIDYQNRKAALATPIIGGANYLMQMGFSAKETGYNCNNMVTVRN